MPDSNVLSFFLPFARAWPGIREVQDLITSALSALAVGWVGVSGTCMNTRIDTATFSILVQRLSSTQCMGVSGYTIVRFYWTMLSAGCYGFGRGHINALYSYSYNLPQRLGTLLIVSSPCWRPPLSGICCPHGPNKTLC
jgi:hypothetical protein